MQISALHTETAVAAETKCEMFKNHCRRWIRGNRSNGRSDGICIDATTGGVKTLRLIHRVSNQKVVQAIA